MDKLKMHSPDLTEQNIEKIRALFPGVVTEAHDANGKLRYAVDFDALKQELSDSIVEGPQERYHLNWPGKREAMITANAPIAKTLRPCREESVDFDNTKNLFIEGDNLDALKLLQETYLGKVKMIYIDPPYNTGNDFIYDDDYSEDLSEFSFRSGQSDESGSRLVTNTEANGRFHSDWLSMMVARLKLARSLLKEDGLIFISIDDNEASSLKVICDEVFGKGEFLASLVWKSRQNKDNRADRGVSKDHEYVICYGGKLRGDERKVDQYSNEDNDPRGVWVSANMVGLATKDRRPNLHYDLIDDNDVNFGCPEMGWRYNRKTMSQLIGEGRVLWPASSEGRPRRKVFLKELSEEYTGVSSIIGSGKFTRNGTSEIKELFGFRAMDFPKPVGLLKDLVEQGACDGEIVLDFFSGSSTTADAVLQINAEDGYERKFIMVQIPEICADKSEALNAGLATIAELGKERIRRAGKKVLEGNCHPDWNKDIGFRVLKIDSSNMAGVHYTPDATSQDQLFGAVDNIKPDRTDPEDLLFQVMLDWGVDLTLPIRRESIDGKTVLFVDDTALVACFDLDVSEDLVKKLTDTQPLRLVFRDTGFASDAVKINAEQIVKQASPHTDIKAI